MPPKNPSTRSKQEKVASLTVEQRKQLKPFLKARDWGLIFEELMRRDLIDVLNFQNWRTDTTISFDSFYDEEIQFRDPDQLTDMFTQKEQDNLFTIHRIQETDENIEFQSKQTAMMEQSKKQELEALKKSQAEKLAKT